ncbi:HAD family hydrolase [Zavarzinia aquatilis]|uniref:Alpha,alpha-trehalose-phosphate synthase n=1 Tax=Zavarzinia aquatilis TaxID=2211142 RepID=A0A317EG91_9PROT|nr:HAD family hydrolase [Zavarzinia aquatilis]PWR25869.1 alpha,alpha-trehalose-phosphate synthase [Zavarzinia aquatilis]
MTGWDCVLATDLDGTFLGGDAASRESLYRSLSERDDVLLVFVTGRDIAFIADLVSRPPMPRPRYIVGDVGTSVYDGMTLEPMAALEEDIAARWQDAGPRVVEMLRDEPGLRLQPTRFRHRVSYDCEPALLAPDLGARVEAAGLDGLLSAGRFFDVLPRGIAKGPTLTRLVDHLGIDRKRVLVAGDTMNDLSLFETGFKGVAVGNAEPALALAVSDMPNVYRSRGEGAAGIAEALKHFEFRAGGAT